MDKKTALKLAEKFAEEVRNKYDLSKIFLFGSYTRGNYHPESDIDIAVLIDGSKLQRENFEGGRVLVDKPL